MLISDMKYYLIICMLFLSLNAKDFSVVMEKAFENALFDITEDYDRTISAVGFTKEYKQPRFRTQTYKNAFDYLASVSESYGSKMAFVKIDADANILNDKIINISKFSEAVAVVKTPQNGYFVGGYTLDGSLVVVKLDMNANTIFTKVFGTKNYDRMNKLVLLNDGGVLSVGTSITSRSKNDNIFETGIGLNDIYLTRFTQSGEILWSKKYGTKYDDRGVDAVESIDGSIIVVGTTSYDANNSVTLMRITENGNKIWLKEHKDEKNVTPHKIIRLKDNNFLLSLSKSDELFKEQIRLMKFNLQNNILIDKEIPTTYSSVLKDIKEYSNGNIIGVGYVKDSYNTDALAVVFDNTLNMLNQEHYGSENYDSFNAVTILHNSKAAVAGINTHISTQESNMWITALKQDGTLSQIPIKPKSEPKKLFYKETQSTEPLIMTQGQVHSVTEQPTLQDQLYKELQKTFNKELQNNTLKIKLDLTIELVHKRLLFKQGEYKLTSAQKGFLKLFASKLIPLLEKYQKHIGTLEVNGHTSSEWGETSFQTNYLNNERLSMGRAYETLTHIFQQQDLKTQKWLSEIFKGSGLAFSKKMISNDAEDKKQSRRVSFKVITN